MGFLDDLRRQADELRASQQQLAGRNERNALLADAACKSAFQYWLQLAQQLNTLRPVNRSRYVLDARHVLHGLPATDFRVDSRRRTLHGQEAYDHVVLHWSVRGGRRLTLARDFVADIERLEARLTQAGIQPLSTATRDPDNGKLLAMHYEFDDTIACSVRLQPDHDRASLQLQLVNVEALETVRCVLPAIELGNGRLDELARWIVGDPNRFLEGSAGLTRQAPP